MPEATPAPLVRVRSGDAARQQLVIVPCGAKKATIGAGERIQAAALYTGPYFRACLAWARSIAVDDDIRILSAKYGLLRLDELVTPYEQRMGEPGAVEWRAILAQAREQQLLERRVTGLGGASYRAVIRRIWPTAILPLAGVGGIGRQLALLATHGRRPASEWDATGTVLTRAGPVLASTDNFISGADRHER